MQPQQDNRGCSVPLDKQLSTWEQPHGRWPHGKGTLLCWVCPLAQGSGGSRDTPRSWCRRCTGPAPAPPPLLLKPHFQSCLHRTVMAAEKATWAEQVFTHQGQVCFPRTRHLLSPQCSPLGPHLGHLCCHPVSSYTPGSIKPSFEMLLGVVSPNKHAGMCAWETRTAFWGNKRYFSPFPTFPHFQLTH